MCARLFERAYYVCVEVMLVKRACLFPFDRRMNEPSTADRQGSCQGFADLLCMEDYQLPESPSSPGGQQQHQQHLHHLLPDVDIVQRIAQLQLFNSQLLTPWEKELVIDTSRIFPPVCTNAPKERQQAADGGVESMSDGIDNCRHDYCTRPYLYNHYQWKNELQSRHPYNAIDYDKVQKQVL